MAAGDYHTHYPVLAAALAAQPTGPVLELGAGDWSTVMLHMMCSAQGRELVTLETSDGWLSKFQHLSRPWHRLVHVDRWEAFADIDTVDWGVAFVDHFPQEDRCREIQRLRSHTQLIVVHDSEPGAISCLESLPPFRYRYDFRLTHPNTSVLSDLRPIPWDAVREEERPQLSALGKVAVGAAVVGGLGYLLLR